MSDPDRRATMDVLTVLTTPALFTNLNFFRLVVFRMAAFSLEHGNTDGSCLAYEWLGGHSRQVFRKYQAGLRFGELGLDLVENRGLGRLRARVYLAFAVACRLMVAASGQIDAGAKAAEPADSRPGPGELAEAQAPAW